MASFLRSAAQFTRLLFLAFALALTLTSVASAADNSDARIVLHAASGTGNSACDAPVQSGLDCSLQDPNVSVDPGEFLWIYVYANNFEAVSGVQLRLDWDASWTVLSWVGSCLPNEIAAATPSPTSGELSVAFDCQQSTALLPLGRLLVYAGTSGTTLEVAESAFPDGTHVVDCEGVPASIGAGARGAVGVSIAGTDPCVNPPPPPTFRRARAIYQRP